MAEEAPAKPKRTRRKKAEAVEVETAPAIEVPVAQDTAPVEAGEGEEGDNEDGTPRRGWWQRTFGA